MRSDSGLGLLIASKRILPPSTSVVSQVLWKVNKNEKEMKDIVPGEALPPVQQMCNVFGEALLEGDDVVHILIRGHSLLPTHIY